MDKRDNSLKIFIGIVLVILVVLVLYLTNNSIQQFKTSVAKFEQVLLNRDTNNIDKELAVIKDLWGKEKVWIWWDSSLKNNIEDILLYEEIKQNKTKFLNKQSKANIQSIQRDDIVSFTNNPVIDMAIHEMLIYEIMKYAIFHQLKSIAPDNHLSVEMVYISLPQKIKHKTYSFNVTWRYILANGTKQEKHNILVYQVVKNSVQVGIAK